jgi:TRAP-type mannitol/chloroaromatic compound transport system permease small subunit
MKLMLKLSGLVDALNRRVGQASIWLILGAVLISAGNAIVRKVFDTGSNLFLDLQWYLFAASFMLAAGYTLLNNEHVRIDVLIGRFSRRTQTWIDIFGFLVFLVPFSTVVIYLGVPFFLQGLRSGEVSANAASLLLWPVYLMIPLGFFLLLLQGISELIKRIAFLQGLIDDPTKKAGEKSAEEELAEAIRQQALDRV